MRARTHARRRIVSRWLQLAIACACLLTLAGSSSELRAAPCPVNPGVPDASPRLAAATMAERFDFITYRLDLARRRALAWSLGWGLTYVTSAAAQLTVTPFVDNGTKKDLYVGASSALIGAITRAVSRPKVIREHRRLRRRIEREGFTCDTLHAAEQALARSARWEVRNRRLFLQLGAVGFNVGVGLVLGLALDRPVQGIRQAAIGSTVAQVMFLTQPMLSARTLERYRSGHIVPSGRPATSGPRIQSGPLVLPRGGGLSLSGAF